MKALIPIDAVASPLERPRKLDAESVNLADVVVALMRRWWIIALLGAAGGAAGLMAARATPPQYVAVAQVMLETRQQNVFATEEVVPALMLDDRAMASEVAVMRSRGLIQAALDRVDLTGRPGFDAELMRPSLPRRAVAGGLALLGVASDPGALADPPRSAVVDAALDALSVAQDGISYVMTVRFATRDPELSAAFVNAIVDAYVDGQSGLRRDATEAAASFLSERVDNLREAVRRADAEVVRQREAVLSFGEGGLDSAIARSEAAGLDAAAARADRIALEAEVGQIEQGRASVADDASLMRFLEPQLFADFSQQRGEAVRVLDAASASVGPRHPRVIEALAQVKAVDAAIAAAVDDRLARLRDELGRAQRREALALDNAADAEQRVVALRRAGIALAQTESEAQVARNVYESMMLRLNEVRAQEAKSLPDARILSRAEPPRGPSWPRPGLFGITGVLAGACFAAAFVLVREASRRPYQSPADIERELGLRVLARLPRVKARDPSALLGLVRAAPHHPYVERLRNLRTAISVVRTGQTAFVVTFCSALRGEGKTATALAFAQSCGASGMRTALIDADLRSPSLSRALGFAAVADDDLVQLIDGGDAIAPRLALPNVDFIPCRRNATGRVERLGDPSLDALFARLRSGYDVIVIDTPPLLAVSDAAWVVRRSDLAALVVAEGITPRRLVSQAVDALRAVGAPDIAVVMTMGSDDARRYAYPHLDLRPKGAPR